MSDKNIDKDILLLREIQANFKLEEGINREISGIYNSVTKRFIHDYMIVNSIENVLSELNKYQEAYKIFVNLNSNLKSELETYKKIAEKLGEFVGFRTTGCPYIPKKPCHNNIDYGKSCKECIIDWARKEVLKDEEK